MMPGFVPAVAVSASASGDDNEVTTLIGSDNNAIGEGATANDIDGDNNAVGDNAVAVEGVGNAVGAGATAVNVAGDNQGIIETGEGDAEGIVGSAVGAAGFGDGGGDVNAITNSAVGQASFGDGAGDQTVVDIDDSAVIGSAVQTGDGNKSDIDFDNSTNVDVDAEVDNSIDFDNTVDNSQVLNDTDIVENNVANIADSDFEADNINLLSEDAAGVVVEDAEELPEPT